VLGLGFVAGCAVATCRARKEAVVQGTVQGREPLTVVEGVRPVAATVSDRASGRASAAASHEVKDETNDVEAEALAQLALVRRRR
jgi:hypothetical protein